ncbi:MAG: bifunctional riboflavin kinase/FAD synthetase, partial [Candidatus Omnitrophica bacterium]|nr:bifunctional riboflavin kinase/FAD synthetase [Candidatus Omnitrophota bacterium]
MKILYSVKKLPHMNRPMATIGIFDGVHVGHQKLLRRLAEKAHRKKKKAIVITFIPHPYRILHPGKAPPMLLSLSHRLKILDRIGIDIALILNFNKHLSCFSAEDFVKKILVKGLNIEELFIGGNFALGHNRKGRLNLLKKLSLKYGFKLNIIKCRKVNRQPISSTSIRELLMDGKLKKASFGLGRKVSILGTVTRGDKRGRILGFPTSNLDLHHEAVPPAGVYAVFVRLNKKLYKGILNIGFRPTFKKAQREKTVEAYIFDFKKNIYGKDMEVVFVKKIREERHFKHKDHLRGQIEKDAKQAKKILESVITR